MLKNLFGRKKAPTENGNSGPKLEQGQWVKKFELILANMEDTPSYELTHQLTVGKEVGNIIVDDASISPRHATFTLQEGVVSVIDHGSTNGTSVNGKKIPVGKFIILQESDTISVGDLEIKIETRSEQVTADDLPPEEIEPVLKTVVIPEESGPVAPSIVQKSPPPPRTPPKKPAQKKKNNFTMKSYQASNALLRVFAVLGDFALAYIVLILFWPFDEFREGINTVPLMISDLTQLDWSVLWTDFKTAYMTPAEILEDITAIVLSYVDLLSLVIVYAGIRLLSTLIFGVSFSQLIFGMRAGMHGIWARIGGVFRVLIGFFTWPFLIFDLPALVSKRTFKEVITHTHLYTSSKVLAFIGSVIYPIFLLGLILIAPLFRGLEIPEPIFINTKIEERVKAEEPVATAPTTEPADTPSEAEASPEGTDPAAVDEGTVIPEPAVIPPEKLLLTSGSEFLGLSLTYDGNEFTLLPTFKFMGVSSKTKLQSGVAILTKGEMEASAELELLKNFDFKQLLGIAIRGNPLLFNRYPEIYEFVYAPEQGNIAFQAASTPEKDAAFVKEFIDLMKTSFELSSENFIEVMQTKTPLLSGLVDFKASLLALLGEKEFADQTFIKIGDVVFLRLHYLQEGPHDLLIPIRRGEGRLYQVSFMNDPNQNQVMTRNKIYKYALYDAKWSYSKKSHKGEALTPLEVIDAFSLDYPQGKLGLDKAQSLYGYYYEQSARILENGSSREYQVWNSSLADVLQILQAIGSKPVEEGAEDPKQKLLQNFRDLKDAFEARNKQFFGVSPTVVMVTL